MNRNRFVILAGIVILAGALLVGWAGAQQQSAAAGGCCVGKMNAAPAAMAGADTAPAQCKMCSQCPMMQGAGKEIRDAYMNDTAGLRKDLAEARKQLDAALNAKPINKAAVSELVAKVNSLQSALFAKTVDMCVAVKEQLPAGQACEMCNSSVACCMMMGDQCPMNLRAGKGGCCGAMKPAPGANANSGCGMGGCMMKTAK